MPEEDAELTSRSQLGMTGVKRVESLNDDPTFIRALADIAADHLRALGEGRIGPTSVQMGLRCPSCTNPKCGKSKEFFAGQDVTALHDAR